MFEIGAVKYSGLNCFVIQWPENSNPPKDIHHYQKDFSRVYMSWQDKPSSRIRPAWITLVSVKCDVLMRGRDPGWQDFKAFAGNAGRLLKALKMRADGADTIPHLRQIQSVKKPLIRWLLTLYEPDQLAEIFGLGEGPKCNGIESRPICKKDRLWLDSVVSCQHVLAGFDQAERGADDPSAGRSWCVPWNDTDPAYITNSVAVKIAKDKGDHHEIDSLIKFDVKRLYNLLRRDKHDIQFMSKNKRGKVNKRDFEKWVQQKVDSKKLAEKMLEKQQTQKFED